MHGIGHRDIKLGPRNVVGPGEVNLPQGLFGQPLFCSLFRDLGCGSKLFDGSHPFPVPLGAVVDLREFGFHACILVYIYGLQEAKGGISKGKCARPNEKQLAILLLRAGLVVVRELRLHGHCHLCAVSLVVESQGCVCVFEIVEGFVLFAVLLHNPVQELRAILLVLCVVPLILLKGQVVSLLFIQRGLAAVARQILREIVASDESGRVEDGPANHNSDSCHCVYVWLLHIGSCVCALTHW